MGTSGSVPVRTLSASVEVASVAESNLLRNWSWCRRQVIPPSSLILEGNRLHNLGRNQMWPTTTIAMCINEVTNCEVASMGYFQRRIVTISDCVHLTNKQLAKLTFWKGGGGGGGGGGNGRLPPSTSIAWAYRCPQTSKLNVTARACVNSGGWSWGRVLWL